MPHLLFLVRSLRVHGVLCPAARICYDYCLLVRQKSGPECLYVPYPACLLERLLEAVLGLAVLGFVQTLYFPGVLKDLAAFALYRQQGIFCA